MQWERYCRGTAHGEGSDMSDTQGPYRAKEIESNGHFTTLVQGPTIDVQYASPEGGERLAADLNAAYAAGVATLEAALVDARKAERMEWADLWESAACKSVEVRVMLGATDETDPEVADLIRGENDMMNTAEVMRSMPAAEKKKQAEQAERGA